LGVRELEIKARHWKDAFLLSLQIPEFDDPYPEEEYHRRLTGIKHLVLVAYVDGQPVGFKVGYERDTDGSFYSWMGGVLPAFRGKGIARRLARRQEAWARGQGYRSIRLKTRRKHQAMLQFALEDGFRITGSVPKNPPQESRIMLEKTLQ